MDERETLRLPLCRLYERYPFLEEFFLSCALTPPPKDSEKPLDQWFEDLELFTLDEVGIDREELPEHFLLFLEQMAERRQGTLTDVQSITILGGQDKSGEAEHTELTLRKGEVVSIVGPTGSGKSRLLSDIEWLAQRDTPTKRAILVNGEPPPPAWRFSIDKKLVAQLSQNMNFVMDITVEHFLRMHCESRMVPDTDEKIAQMMEAANRLAGEPLEPDMPVTSLSGGQSRALMIADTAYVSTSPIILIDEIENAGISRKEAVSLLIRAEKIVLMATHDPILALRADRRIVIKNGGIRKVLETTEAEKETLAKLEKMNDVLLLCREQLRSGEQLHGNGTDLKYALKGD